MWVVLCEYDGEVESIYGPFESREDAVLYSKNSNGNGCGNTHFIREMDTPNPALTRPIGMFGTV